MFERKPPIRSTQEDVAELADDIDRFVIGLAERIDAIQDAEFARKTGEVVGGRSSRLSRHGGEREGRGDGCRRRR